MISRKESMSSMLLRVMSLTRRRRRSSGTSQPLPLSFWTAKLDIPVALSSLVQLPWIAATLKPDEKIAVLTANEESCTPDLLRACSVPDEVIERCVIRGLGKEPQFKVILDDSCEFDNAQIKQELLGKAEEIVREYPETGTFLLECTEMPPYAYLIQAATQCRVYDFITMLNWVHSGLCRRPFTGWV